MANSINRFVDLVSSVAFANTFNPYRDICEIYDCKDSSNIRRKLLLEILTSAKDNKVDSLWIGRDLGYKGGRRTGLALTDDFHVHAHLNRWGIEQDTLQLHSTPVAERTATVIWNVLNKVEEAVFLWNVFPFHPYLPNQPFTNRSHNSFEREVGEFILFQLINLLEPKKLIAIGNDAASSLNRIVPQHEILHVRHPSYGGQSDFINSMYLIYCLD